MLKEILIDGLIKGGVDTFLSILLWILLLSFMLLGCYATLYLADTIAVPTSVGEAKLISVHYTPAHTTTTIVPTGKTVVPILTLHPDSWSARFESEKGTDSVGVSKEFYSTATIGVIFEVYYKIGRVTKSLHIVGIVDQTK